MTVKSLIEPKLEYSENKTVDIDDIHYSTSIYDYELFNEDVEIALGKGKEDTNGYNILFYSVYLIYNGELKSRIGIFEGKSENMIELIDENGIVDLSKVNVHNLSEVSNSPQIDRKGNLIIFIKEDDFKKYINMPVKEKADIVEEDEEEKIEDKNIDDVVDLTEDDDVTEIKIKSQEEMENVESWYVENAELKKPRIKSETKEESNKEKELFKRSTSNMWVQNYMKNINYEEIDNEGSGDCFFAVIRDALKDVGKVTTVDKLRKMVSEDMNEETFQHYRSLYLSLSGELKNKEEELLDLKTTMKKIQKNEKKHTRTAEETRIIKEQLDDIVKKYNEVLEEKKQVRENLHDFEFMKEYDTLEKFKDYVLTSQYWADDYTISYLEDRLKIKMIILSKEAYDEKAEDSVIQCGQLKDEDSNSEPEHYIITSYVKKHYTLITYKEKGALSFEEIPYGIKALIINKCLEKTAGPFYKISDFKKLREDMEIEIEESDDEIDIHENDLYEKGEVIMIHSKSFNKPKPGKGQGEATSDVNKYSELISLANKNKEWRRMLDDSYIQAMMIDGKKWSSVKHFMLGSQFKRKNIDLYNEFSLDGNENSKVALQVEDAIKYSNENRKKIESEFKSITSTKKEEAREKALKIKFGESVNMMNILKSTYPAKLLKFHRGKEAESDLLLMKLRKSFHVIKN